MRNSSPALTSDAANRPDHKNDPPERADQTENAASDSSATTSPEPQNISSEFLATPATGSANISGRRPRHAATFANPSPGSAV